MITSSQRKNMLNVWVRPRLLFKTLAEQEKSEWLFPLLIITMAVLFYVYAESIVQQKYLGELIYPNDFQYYLPEEQERFKSAMSISRGALFLFFFPAFARCSGIWLQWLFLSVLLAFFWKLGRGRFHSITVRNMVAWALLPLSLRFIIQGVYVFINQQSVAQVGISKLLGESMGSSPSLLLYIFGALDFYYLWHIFLLLLGSIYTSKIPAWRSIPLTILAVLLLLSLSLGWEMLITELNLVLGL